jgi:sugar/nucleoside kinase (ribokinase family)
MNEAEARAFSDGLKSEAQETLFENNKKFPLIVVKMGQGGALCYSEGKIIRAETKAVTPVDATGAGDAFCAGFLAAWINSKPLNECTAFGNMIAASVLGAEGSQADKKALKKLAGITKNSGPMSRCFNSR